MSDNKENILKSLEPMFEQAIRERKWFFSTYQALEFSPKELRKCHSEDRFIWGPVNWKLIDPPKYKNISIEIEKMEAFNDSLKLRIEDGWNI